MVPKLVCGLKPTLRVFLGTVGRQDTEQSAPTIRGPRGCRKPVLLQKDLFLVICMHICVCHVSVGINRDQKRASYPQEL